MRKCPTCLDEKVVSEPCRHCKGEGFLRKKLLFRKQMKFVNCKKCIWGAIIKLCPTCKGLGQVP